MKVLMLARPNLLSYPGGDTTQILRTAEALRELNVEIDLNPSSPDYSHYDLLHFFNLIDPEDILGHLRRSSLPYVVSTVYCRYHEYDRHHRRDLVGQVYRFLSPNGVEYVKTIGKWLLKGERISSYEFLWRGHGGSIRRVLRGAACLLPNSESEYQRVLADFGIERPYIVVPNGVDIQGFDAEPAPVEQRHTVLCVARIEGRKNQLNLIRALNDTSLEVWLVGQAALNQPSYYRQCRQAAASNIHFSGYLPFEEVLEHYRRARVHVLPSWFETTGLSSLEAALMGCNCVVGDRGDVREYFGTEAWYCDPASPESIREAVLEAYRHPFRETLREKIFSTYNWQEAARLTLEAYQVALFSRRRSW